MLQVSDKECYRRTEVKISLERRREVRSRDEKRGSRSDMRKKDVSGRNDGHKDRELDEASMGTAACGRISENINLRLRNSVNDQKSPILMTSFMRMGPWRSCWLNTYFINRKQRPRGITRGCKEKNFFLLLTLLSFPFHKLFMCYV